MVTLRLESSAAIVAFLLVGGCGDGEGTSGSGGGGTSGSGTGGDDRGEAGSGSGFTEGEPSVPCERYVACVAATSPETLEQIDAQYGEDGDCWSRASLAEACTDGCVDALAEARVAFPDEERCTACDDDDDCTDPSAGRCLAGACHACIESADCVGSPAGPACVSFVCDRDPAPACVAQALSNSSGRNISGNCVYDNCLPELDALFGPGGLCEGVEPCGPDLGCLEGASETPFAACIDESCPG